MEAFLDRVAVLVSTAVTYLVAAAVGLSAVAQEIATVAPEGGETVTAWLLRAVAWIGVAVATARRVSPVAADQRGLLPPS